MNEEQRIKVLRKIEKDLEKENALKEKKKEIEKFLEDEKIREYLKLVNELEQLEKEQKKFSNSKEKMIEYEFAMELEDITGKKITNCQHEIWIYEGSYGYKENYPTGIKRVYDEESYKFHCNRYKCLECGKKTENYIWNWRNFEQENFVLKSRNIENVEFYRNLYYKLLFEYPTEEAQEKLIQEFIQKEQLEISYIKKEYINVKINIK